MFPIFDAFKISSHYTIATLLFSVVSILYNLLPTYYNILNQEAWFKTKKGIRKIWNNVLFELNSHMFQLIITNKLCDHLFNSLPNSF